MSRAGSSTRGAPAGGGTGRLALGCVGVALVAYGGWLLAAELLGDRAASTSALLWLAGGALLHDLVLVPATVLVSWLAARVLPGPWRAALAGGLVVLGSTTLVAVPLLVGIGGYEPNTTLLSRDYWQGWWALAVATGLGVVVVGLVRQRRSARHA
ncbi:hypothetical protein [Nocardioides perillae]|uniref:Uncharacterized protein n=1 Tax=Nocardioides perillae TaxID=1119534 RepID=A0A7Y9UVA3_9ACTN|nr:hypothetical protein [Nocardioides perillae]NYG56145.1 hypothetical protein [Nocardioides perillae]